MYFPNLERLKTVLFQVEMEQRRFDMGTWFALEPEEQNKCGTVCCAAGWGALDPVLQDRGLMLCFLDKDDKEVFVTSLDQLKKIDPEEVEVSVTYKNYTAFEATRHFFNISVAASDYLFDPSTYTHQDEEITPLMVIDRINAVIACGGNMPGEFSP